MWNIVAEGPGCVAHHASRLGDMIACHIVEVYLPFELLLITLCPKVSWAILALKYGQQLSWLEIKTLLYSRHMSLRARDGLYELVLRAVHGECSTYQKYIFFYFKEKIYPVFSKTFFVVFSMMSTQFAVIMITLLHGWQEIRAWPIFFWLWHARKRSFLLLYHLIPLPSLYFSVLADSTLQNVLISPLGPHTPASPLLSIKNSFTTIQYRVSICPLSSFSSPSLHYSDREQSYFPSSELHLCHLSLCLYFHNLRFWSLVCY